MLDGGGDHVLCWPVRIAHDAEQRQVVRLGAAADKHDFLRLAADQRGHLPPRQFQALLGHLPEMMDTGRVAIHFGQTRHHRLEDLRGHRRRRVMVEVKTLHFLLV